MANRDVCESRSVDPFINVMFRKGQPFSNSGSGEASGQGTIQESVMSGNVAGEAPAIACFFCFQDIFEKLLSRMICNTIR